MKKAQGLRRYFYEYVFHQAVETARARTGEIIPVSQAKRIRQRVDERLAEAGVDRGLADPALPVSTCLRAIDGALGDHVSDHVVQFGDDGVAGEEYRALESEFMRVTGVAAGQGGPGGNPGLPGLGRSLPISPYDPDWSDRSTIKRAGAELCYLPDATIESATDGVVADLAAARHGQMMLMRLDDNAAPVEAGRAMTYEDASGLSALMDKMSEREYNSVRDWVIDGGRDPRSGRIDVNRFMPASAVARSAAMLEELKAQGLSYSVMRDREPGQIKAVLADSKMEIRLIDAKHEAFAGARIYDNGTEVRYSTNHRLGTGVALHSPSPEEAVQLLRFAQGLPVERTDGAGLVGEVGPTHVERGRNGQPVQIPDAVHNDRDSMFVVGDYPGQSGASGSKLMLRRDSKNRSLPRRFGDMESATKYLEESTDSARANFVSALDVERLISEYEDVAASVLPDEERPAPPELSADPEIAAIQRTYWDVLSGARSELLRPGASEDMYRARLRENGADDLGNLVYLGSAAEKIREHAEDAAFELIGTAEAIEHEIDGEWVLRRFDPARVAKYMDSPTGQWNNLDNLASALRRCEVPPSQLLGEGFQSTRFKDQLVGFDASTAVPMLDHENEFVARMGRTVHEAISRNGVIPEGQILIDDKGVVQWQGLKQRRNGSTEQITGEIGQIFAPGAHGEIVTAFASGDNATIVPGYEARIVANAPGERPTSVEERTVLRGYEQMMAEKIQYQIAADLVSGRTEAGSPASLNPVYSQIYGTKHPETFIADHTHVLTDPADGTMRLGLDQWTAAIVATEARRVRYSNEIKQGSTVYAEYQAKRDRSDPTNDNHFDTWQLTGGRNMAVLTGTDSHGIEAPGGFFDPVMTGGATNQGIVRYLTAAAEVGPDGWIVPGDATTLEGSRAPLMMLPELETMDYDPFDRQQMTTSTIMQSSQVTEPRSTALMTFGGWTADDAIVISAEMARSQRIRGSGGVLRDLVVGDKLSDLHGNKGVVSLVVDRDMDLDEARAKGIEAEVAWFRANPGMDVVMSPFSLISRRNAGAGRELLDSVARAGFTAELRSPDGTVVEAGGLGQMRFVVTHMAVDEKTKVYDDEQILAGRGRKASSQLAWALGSQDCPAIMSEFYGHNSGAEANLREHLQVVGIDMEADGTLRLFGEQTQSEGRDTVDERPERRLLEMPPLQLTARNTLNTGAMRRAFGELIADKGGDMEIPFPLTFPTGEKTERVSATSWRLPVLSSHLRSGQEFEDGTSVPHDHTRQYQAIFVQACRYRFISEALADDSLSTTQRTQLRQDLSDAANQAQRSYDAMSNDITSRVLSGKNNHFKTGLMSSRLSDSATMVWSANPLLDIDAVGLNSEKAAQLGLAEGDHALVWRDPVLRDAGVRYLRVVIDDELTGAAINPVMDKCFDGDFDGDAVAVVKLHSAAAKAEAMEKLTVAANLLDTGVVSERGTHPFAMQVSLDTQVAVSRSTSLQNTLAALSGEANLNAVEPAFGSDELKESLRQRNRDSDKALVGKLSDFYREAQRGEFGSALRFDDIEAHVASVKEVCVDTGAKGSEKKLEDYARYLGVADGASGITKADQEASMFATAIKAHGTGLGGSFSQRAVRALRDTDLKAVLEVTYPVTQSILQAKHDAAEARHKYEMLQGPGRDLWRGAKMEHVGPGMWRSEYADGELVQATKEEWAAQFVEFYEAKDGFNVQVNPAYVEKVAEALSDPATGLVRNLEKDTSLQGTVMDRMAYGGDFATLVEAAKAGESVFDGEKNAQFACATTRDVRAELALSPTVVVRDTSILKRDVLAEQEVGAQARGSQRRSKVAVGVAGQQTRPETVQPQSRPKAAQRPYVPLSQRSSGFEQENPTSPTQHDEHEMGY